MGTIKIEEKPTLHGSKVRQVRILARYLCTSIERWSHKRILCSSISNLVFITPILLLYTNWEFYFGSATHSPVVVFKLLLWWTAGLRRKNLLSPAKRFLYFLLLFILTLAVKDENVSVFFYPVTKSKVLHIIRQFLQFSVLKRKFLFLKKNLKVFRKAIDGTKCFFWTAARDDFKSSRELCLCACVFVCVGRVISEVSGETEIIRRYCLFLFSVHDDQLNLVDVSKELRIPFGLLSSSRILAKHFLIRFFGLQIKQKIPFP